MPWKDIVGWDDPFSDEGAWIVPAESEAAARFARIRWYRKHVDARVSSLPAAASNRSAFACDMASHQGKGVRHWILILLKNPSDFLP
jgi:hypothetical protein